MFFPVNSPAAYVRILAGNRGALLADPSSALQDVPLPQSDGHSDTQHHVHTEHLTSAISAARRGWNRE